MSAGTRAAAQKASLQQHLAGRGGGGEDDGDDGTSELGSRQAKTPKTTESIETSLVYFTITNSETELPGRNDHVLFRTPTGLAVACTAGIDQTPVDAIRGKHQDKLVFSAYKTNVHKGLKSYKQSAVPGT